MITFQNQSAYLGLQLKNRTRVKNGFTVYLIEILKAALENKNILIIFTEFLKNNCKNRPRFITFVEIS